MPTEGVYTQHYVPGSALNAFGTFNPGQVIAVRYGLQVFRNTNPVDFNLRWTDLELNWV